MAWWLVFHLLGVVLWIGGLLTISRMAAYHVAEAPGVRPRFAWVEGRMYWLVTIPGMVITLITAGGLLNAGTLPYGQLAWFHKKMLLVGALLILQAFLHIKLGQLKAHPERQKKALFSALHGTIGLTLIGLLIMVEVRP